MSKRNLLNILLFIIILILVMFVIYEPGKDIAAIPPTLTNLKKNSINHIKISRNQSDMGEQELVFKKTAKGWLMLKPYQLMANTFRIESILEILSTPSLSQNDLTNLDQSKFGLNKPPATITFNNETSIIFGHNKSLNNNRYVNIGSTLNMIADTFYYQLAAKAESYISHDLLIKKSNIVKISLPNMLLEKEEGKWQVTPAADDLSADSINQLISEWQLSQAYDINIVKLKAQIKPDISIQLNNDEIIRFIIEANKNSFNLINIDSGVRYILSADRKDKLLKLSSITQDD